MKKETQNKPNTHARGSAGVFTTALVGGAFLAVSGGVADVRVQKNKNEK